MLTYAFVCAVCASWFLAGYAFRAVMEARRRERGYVPPPAFTLTSRPTGTASPTGAGDRPRTAAASSSTVTLGDPLAGQVWPVTLAEPNRPAAPTGYGDLEGGNRGNGLLPYAGCDD